MRGPDAVLASDSRTTWALIPPKPMALTPARSGRSAGQGRPFFKTRSGRRRSPVSSGCGCSQPVVGGRIWASRARAALISPATPAAALVWPMLALIEPIAAGGSSRAHASRERAAQRTKLGRVAHARARAVAFEVGDRLDSEPGSPIGAAQGQELPLDLGAREPPVTVRRDPPAADDRDDPSALGQRVGQPHEHDDAAAFARPEAGRSGVVDPHRVLGQGAGLGETDQLERVEAQVDAARQRRRRGRRPPAPSRRGRPPAATTRTPHRPCSHLP